MLNATATMRMVRDKISKDRNEMPSLLRRTKQLGLHPQPWWNADFARWAIRRAEDVMIAKGTYKEGEEDE